MNYAHPQYVRVTLRVASANGKDSTVTIWAIKLGTGHYRKVNAEGDWGLRGVDSQYLAAAADIVKEVPAGLSKKYGNLTTKMGEW